MLMSLQSKMYLNLWLSSFFNLLIDVEFGPTYEVYI